MNKKTQRIVSSAIALLACLQAVSPVVGFAMEETDTLGNYALLAYAADDALRINAQTVSMNSAVLSNGTCTIDAETQYLNGNVEENAGLLPPYLHTYLERTYFWGDDVDAYTSDLCGTDGCGDEFVAPTHIYGAYSTNDNVELQNTAVMVGGNIDIDSNSYLSNSAVLYSASGDINITANNVSVDGMIYAPIGTVTIDADYVNVHGTIIAQNIIINGEYAVNLNTEPGFVNGIIDNATSVELPDHDEDEDPDIGEIRWKNVTSDDEIVFADDEGYYIVKNQILLSCDDSVSYDDVAALADAYDAEIVGYIQITNDYQLEFPADTDMDDLREIIAALSELDCMRMVTFNLVDFSNPEFYTNDSKYTTDLDEDAPAGNDWYLEAIKFGSALVNAGVIPSLDATSADVNTDVLFKVNLGIIDASFDEWHEDMVDQIGGHTLNNYATRDTMVDAGGASHGTKTSGLMAATSGNGKGVTGIAIKNHIRGFAVSTGISSVSSAFGDKAALSWMIGKNVRVINCSMGYGDYAFAAAAPGNDSGKEYITNFLSKQAVIYEDLLSKFLDMGYDFMYCGSAGNSHNSDYYKNPSGGTGYISVSQYNKDVAADPTAHSDVDTTQVYNGSTPGYSTDARYDDPMFMIETNRIRSRIMCVGAMSESYHISDFSCRGDRVDLVAPGENIYNCKDSSRYSNALYNGGSNGTSFSSPIVAGSIGLAYSVNPALDGSLMRILVTNTSTQMIDSTYPLINTANLTNFARIYRTVFTARDEFVSPSQYNGVALATVVDGTTSSRLTDVRVTATRKSGSMNTPVNNKVWKTDTDGQVEVILEPGEYTLLFEKDGYLSESVEFTSEPEDVQFLGEVKLFDKDTYGNSKYTVTGYVSNALNNDMIGGVSLLFRKGWNNREGNWLSDLVATTATTDANGKFTAKLKVGCYTAEVKKNGFITTYANIVVSPNAGTQRISITPVLDSDEFRIVLTWGQNPLDIDAHLTGTYNSTPFYVDYTRMSFSSGSQTIANLDIDDRYSYGPETVTLKWSDAMGDCSFYVHDFTNRSNASSSALSLSSAEVKVYRGNTLEATYKIPMDRVGTIWNVFDIKNGEIVSVNTFQ